MPLNTTQVSPVRDFQFDSGAIGSIPKSVNLFRGDVNMPLTLVSLPGRNGLQVSLTLFYGSNVKTQVTRWNRDAPTGVAGLGWTLPLERIVLLNATTGAPSDNVYALASGADTTRLLPSKVAWLRFKLPEEAATGLNQATAAAALRQGFAGACIRLGATATVSVVTTGQRWRIVDPENQHIFTVERGAEGLAVYDGGQGFEAFNFQFWKIRYYAEFERWEITKDDGNTSVYGGLPQSETEDDQAIEWGVRWNNWRGASNLVKGQVRYPVAWDMRSAFSPWGDEVHYTYLHIEQPVGIGGLTYTKACYLAAIRDMFGRSLDFNYAEKTYVPDKPAGPREYIAPHWNAPYAKAPDDQPGPYQDQFETRYLESVIVRNADGETLDTVLFDYELLNFAGVPSDQNIYGDTVKRCLTSIRLVRPTGDSLPGMRFDYGTAQDPNPGALKAITYPQGGRAGFSYATKSLDICQRSLTIDNPWPGLGAPRVWFGPDYAVVAWYDGDNTRLDLRIYTWVGRWQEWRPAALPKGDIQIETMNVIAGSSSCVVTFRVGHTATRVLVYRKNDLYWGMWQDFADNPIDVKADGVDVVGGDDFFLINDRQTRTIRRYQWQRLAKRWQVETIATGPSFCEAGAGDTVYLVAAGPNYHSVLCYDRKSSPGSKKNRMQIFYRGREGEWHAGGAIVRDFTIGGGDLLTNLMWAPGPSFLAAACTTERQTRTLKYNLMIFGWDTDYQNLTLISLPYSVSAYENGGLGYSPVPQIIDNTLLASGPHLLRYNGERWLANDTLAPKLPVTGSNRFWYAHGPDCAVATQSAESQVIGQFLFFDPTQEVDAWRQAPITLLDEHHPKNRMDHYFPTAGGDYCSFDQKIFCRQTQTGWAQAVARPVAIPGEIDTTTLSNVGSAFMAYLELPGDTPTGTSVLSCKNGAVEVVRQEKIRQRFFQSIGGDGLPVAFQNGRQPGGPNAFFTFLPLTKELRNAQSITIHRYVDAVLEGAISDYPIEKIVIDDGYDVTSTYYAFDSASAACDPTGNIVKYYKSTVYPGAADPGTLPAGRTEQYYLNSLPPDQAPINEPAHYLMEGAEQAYSLLDGLLYRTSVFDSAGARVSENVTDWAVSTSLTVAGIARPLDGGFVRRVGETQTIDGVTSSTRHEYDPECAVEIKQSTTTYDAAGQLQQVTAETVLAFHVYDWVRRANIVSMPAQQITRIAPVADPSRVAVMGLTATVLAPFPRQDATGAEMTVYAPSASYKWRGGKGEPAFRWWDGSPPTADWQLESQVLRRSLHGLPIETLGADGLVQSMIYDRTEEFATASFLNASVGAREANYYGFEPYEPGSGWTVDPRVTPFCASDSQTGTRSLTLPAGSSGPSGEFQPAPGTRALFSCWYKTPENFQPGQAGWQLTLLDMNGRETRGSKTIPFANSAGSWTYLSGVIDVPSIAGIRLRVQAGNPSGSPVLVDNLRIAPFLSDFIGTIYDQRYVQPIACVGPHAQVTRYLYDDFRRMFAQIGPVENVSTISDQYSTLPGAGGAFDRAEPNASTGIAPAGRSIFARFDIGDDWRRNWQCAAPQNWSPEKGVLFHRGSAADTLVLTACALSTDYGMSVNLAYETPPTTRLGLTVGDQISIAWEPAQARWVLTDRRSGITIPAAHPSPQPGKHWLILALPQTLLFFVDGRQLIRYGTSVPVAGAPGLFAAGAIGFLNVLAFAEPSVTRSFTDGAGKQRQKHVLEETTSLISATLYDELGADAVTTVAARCDAGVGQTVLAYRSDFVTAFDWRTGVMSGLVSDLNPTDEGYPYTRTASESSPRRRPIEVGVPGKLFAITTLPPAQRHTVKTVYGTNAQGGVPFGLDLPPGQYSVMTTTDANGGQSYSVTQKTGGEVASGTLLSDRAGDMLQSAVLSALDNDGQTITTRLPNFFKPPAGSKPEDWVTRVRNDLVGDVVERVSPDAGTTRLIYDRAGRLRFSQDAAGAAGDYALYTRYDLLGRIVEEGSFAIIWGDGAALRAKAEEPAWPNPQVEPSTIWTKSYSYDGDGGDPDQIGHLVALSTRRHDQASTEAATETMVYDRRGVIVERGLRVPGDGDREHRIAYRNDNRGRIVHIDYGDGDEGRGAFTVVQSYDRPGNLHRISAGVGDLLRDLGTFHYTAGGNIAAMDLRPGPDVPVLTQRYGYAPPGRVNRIANAHFDEALTYVDPGNAYYDGKIAGATTTFTLPDPPPGFASRLAYKYTYDKAGRLLSAVGDGNPAWNFAGSSAPASYDANGNVLDTRGDGNGALYRYNPGKDQVRETESAGGTRALQHDVRGNLIAATDAPFERIDYDRVSNLPGTVHVAGESTPAWSFVYDGRNQRVLKAGPGKRHIYIRGMHEQPLLERIRDADGRETILRYVYGPNGLLLVHGDDAQYTLLSDHLGSPRLAIDAAGRPAAAFNYLLFGGALGDCYGGSETLARLRYRFTGQELDADLGLYNFRARLYDSALGRFWAVDPANQQASPYAYAGNQPTLFVDPSGELFFVPFLIALAVGAAMGAAAHGIQVGVTGQGNDLRGWAGAIAGGAVAGVAAYATGGLASAGFASAGISTASVPMGMLLGGLTGAAAGVTGALTTNAVEQRANLTDGLAVATLSGIGMGMAMGALGRAVAKYTTNQGIFAALDAQQGPAGPNATQALNNVTLLTGDIGAVNARGNLVAAQAHTIAARGSTNGGAIFRRLALPRASAQNNGILSVFAHGEADGFSVMGPRQEMFSAGRFADAIRSVPVNAPPAPAGAAGAAGRVAGVELLVCNAGRGNVAQTVANKMGVAVRAATDTVRTQGNPIQGPNVVNPGQWRVFSPMGNLSKAINSMTGYHFW